MSDYFRQNHTLSSLPNEGSWIVMNSLEQDIKAKVEFLGTPLKNWDVKIYRGILTGLNPAFIIDTETKNKLIASSPKAEEIIRPIFRGRNIKRYKADFDDYWIIFTRRGIDIESYPSIKDHLMQFYEDEYSGKV